MTARDVNAANEPLLARALRIGYTPKQAWRLKNRIDLDMAKIEDTATAMRHRISDHNLTVDNQLEELREVARQLKAIIDRRTK